MMDYYIYILIFHIISFISWMAVLVSNRTAFMLVAFGVVIYTLMKHAKEPNMDVLK